MAESMKTLWQTLLIVISLAVALAIGYTQIPGFKDFVDAKCPWVKEQTSGAPASEPAPAAAATTGTSVAEPVAGGTAAEPAAKATPEATPAPEPAPTPTPEEVKPEITFTQIAANRKLWPKTVRLKKEVTFPAVFEGKQVGQLPVAAGKIVRLQFITNGVLTVSYTPDGNMDSAGATRVPPEDTDLVERVNKAAQP